VGVEFDWVTPHWIAGTVLAASVVFHIVHASFWLDFWATVISGQSFDAVLAKLAAAAQLDEKIVALLTAAAE
jgi:hypothetical protein